VGFYLHTTPSYEHLGGTGSLRKWGRLN
jgi:hypothetical protein